MKNIAVVFLSQSALPVVKDGELKIVSFATNRSWESRVNIHSSIPC